MMKKILLLLLCAGAMFAVLMMTGWYPVALVGVTPIFARDWRRLLVAEERIIKSRARAEGKEPVNFSLPKRAELFFFIRQKTLTFLIDEVIMKKAGRDIVPDLERLSSRRVRDALGADTLGEQAAVSLYGFDPSLVRKYVLLPQARQEVLEDALSAEKRDFHEWLGDLRARQTVRLFFVPFEWTQDGVRSPPYKP